MSEAWNFYITQVDDSPASIFVDLGIAEEAPQPERPILIAIQWTMLSPNEDGLSSEEEHEKLNQIEDDLVAAIVEKFDAIYVGRITVDGHRDFFFYSSAAEELEETITRVANKHPEYEIAFDSQDDPEWEHYLGVLYPGPEEQQKMHNLQVISALLESGDTLEVERPVSHWIYFQTAEGRDEFSQRVGAEGFQILQENLSEEEGEAFPFGLSIERVDSVDMLAIDEITIFLYNTAEELGGRYDGWETEVIKEE